MDGLSVAANVVAVIDVSVKVITLCSQYSKAVANARADIARLTTMVKGLKTTVDHVKALLEAPQGKSLSTSQSLQDQLAASQSILQELHNKLQPGLAASGSRRFWIRALKWPFSHGEIEAIMSKLEHTLLLHIKHGIDSSHAVLDEDASTARKPRFLVPFPRDPDFVPRPTIQAQIQEQLAAKASRIALMGMGGFGKSQIAVEVAYNVYQSSPEKSIFWIHGASQATIEESYRSIADSLAIPHRHDPKNNILALVRDWLQKDDIAPWLMILDNADILEVYFKSEEEFPIAAYLPKRSNGQILITTRNLNVAEKLTGSRKAIISVPAMDHDQALQLLQEKLSSNCDSAAATDLIHCLNNIPLAVNQAAAYINRREISINEYIKRFKESAKRTGLLHHDAGDIRRYETVSNSVAVTWQVTFNQIHYERRSAASLLSLLSCFQSHNIPRYMLSQYQEFEQDGQYEERDTEALDDDLDVLFAYSLVKASIEPGMYEMHSLVHICTQTWLSERGQTARWDTLLLRLASEHFPSGTLETWHQCEVLLPHIERMLEKPPNDEKEHLDWGILLLNVSRYMNAKGDYNAAVAFSQKSVEARKEILGHDHPDTLTGMGRLALAFYNLGRWEEAERLYVHVLETRKTELGTDHPNTLISMGNIASVYRKQGRWEEAEKLYVQPACAT
ncbi:hypothetical protein NQ176_g10643 [Zarea fungicola]|uniref:Uncharacterized protein n=1 Tax=Zarea fungicola TaxID=93591 RepID=A0ACC1MFC7_9HYPO|nr:hypothetical protein NQ176_g10643 [Lecanicillium fungicola]